MFKWKFYREIIFNWFQRNHLITAAFISSKKSNNFFLYLGYFLLDFRHILSSDILLRRWLRANWRLRVAMRAYLCFRREAWAIGLSCEIAPQYLLTVTEDFVLSYQFDWKLLIYFIGCQSAEWWEKLSICILLMFSTFF